MNTQCCYLAVIHDTNISYLGEVFPEDLDKIGHSKVHDIVSPSQFQDDIRTQEVVTAIQTSSKAVRAANLQEPGNQLLGNLSVPGVTCILHGILWKHASTCQLLVLY